MSHQMELQRMGALPEKRGSDNPAFYTDGTQHAVIGTTPENFYVNVNNDGPSDGLKHRPGSKSPPGDDNNVDMVHQARTQTLDDDSDLNDCARSINRVQKAIVDVFVTYQTIIVRSILVVLLVLYLAYVVYSMTVRFGDEGSIRLLVCTILGLLLLLLYLVWDPLVKACDGVKPTWSPSTTHKVRLGTRWALYFASVVGMVTLLIVLVALDTPDNLMSLGGLAAFIVLAWVTSINPARFYFACIILKTRWGYETFKWLADRVTEFLAYSDAGAAFVFGSNFRVHYFAFAVLPVIVFFSSIISVLYYLGVMQAIVSVIGRFLSFCLGTTPAESLNAAGNIFVGMTDAPLMIRPYIATMTKSELHAVMTGGFATIAGSVFGAYISYGVPANHLLSASVMSAPAALAISKLTYPEVEVPLAHLDDYKKMEKTSERNLIEAASAGASNAILLVANVAVNVLAFLSILAFINATLEWCGQRAGVDGLTFQFICSYVLYPVALFMGTELGNDCRRVAELIGVKTFTNEFIAYGDLQKLLINRQVWKNYSSVYDVSDHANVQYNDLDVNLTQWNTVLTKGFLSTRSEVIATYALCGFSNFGSMGILLGGLSAMAPHRRQEMAAIVLRAMIAGNVACFVTACIAGLFFEDFK